MSSYDHIDAPSADLAVTIVEEALETSSMVVFTGGGGVGKREGFRVVATRWEDDPDRKALLFECMRTTNPKEFVADILAGLNQEADKPWQLRQMTRQLAKLLKDRQVPLMCLAGVEALDPSCIEHIPLLFNEVRRLEHRMALVVTANRLKCNLGPIESHGMWMRSEQIWSLDKVRMVGAFSAWDSRYAPILKSVCARESEGLECADILFKHCLGNFERMIAYQQSVMRRYPKGPLTLKRLTAVTAKRGSSPMRYCPLEQPTLFSMDSEQDSKDTE